MNALEEAVNAITDDDRSWWPFVWLKPAQHARMSLRRLISIALLYGLPCGGALSLVASLFTHSREIVAPIVGFPVLLLFVGTVLVGPMWNRRAERLARRI